eukprot:scaffold23460_cov82-Isochrysis_galbana.AAC.2
MSALSRINNSLASATLAARSARTLGPAKPAPGNGTSPPFAPRMAPHRRLACAPAAPRPGRIETLRIKSSSSDVRGSLDRGVPCCVPCCGCPVPASPAAAMASTNHVKRDGLPRADCAASTAARTWACPTSE